jgi:GR25 family glycosyltransferase involved in LPS biosynthesis
MIKERLQDFAIVLEDDIILKSDKERFYDIIEKFKKYTNMIDILHLHSYYAKFNFHSGNILTEYYKKKLKMWVYILIVHYL